MAATLTDEQREHLKAEDEPHWRMVDPATGIEFVLVPSQHFEYLDELNAREEDKWLSHQARRSWRSTCRQLAEEEAAEGVEPPSLDPAAAPAEKAGTE